MKLYANEVPLDTLGTLRVLSEQRSPEPPEFPQRTRVTQRLRLDFFQQSYVDNRALVEQVYAVIQNGTAQLRWEDESGLKWLDRPVVFGEAERPEETAQGTYWQAVGFTVWFYDHTVRAAAAGMTWQRDAAGAPLLDLGAVEKFTDRNNSQLFSEMKEVRQRSGGLVAASGRKQADTTKSLVLVRAELMGWKTLWDAELRQGVSGRLERGSGLFSEVAKIIDFDCEIDQAHHSMAWTLSASFTRYPDVANHTVTDFRVTNRENKAEGTVSLLLQGTIGAATAEQARARLAALRTEVVPADYVQITGDPVERRVESLSGDQSNGPAGDGQAFIELTFADEWQKVAANVLRWTLRTSSVDDVQSGYIRTTYAGNVEAAGATVEAAAATATALAVSLGAGKYPMLLSSSLTRLDRLFQTAGPFIVPVEFSYEYRRKGTRTYLEVTADAQADTFGQTVEAVSGFIVAPDLATALEVYEADVRNLAGYTGRLMLNERKPVRSYAAIRGVESQDGRFDFSFSLFQPKLSGETAMRVAVSARSELSTLKKVTSVRGSIVAADEGTATAFLDAYLGTLGEGLGIRKSISRESSFMDGPAAVGSRVRVFERMDFEESFEGTATGVAGVLQSDVSEDVTYAGARLVEKPIPGGVSIIQDTGIAPGERTVSGSVRGTTQAACRTFVNRCRNLLMSPAATRLESPARVRTHFVFPEMVDGVASGAGVNVQTFEQDFTFREILPSTTYVE